MPGHPTTLTVSQEQEVVYTYVIFAEWGFGLNKRDIEGIVMKYLKAAKIPKMMYQESGGVGLSSSSPTQAPIAIDMVWAMASNEEVFGHWFEVCLKPALDKSDLLDAPDHIVSRKFENVIGNENTVINEF